MQVHHLRVMYASGVCIFMQIICTAHALCEFYVALSVRGALIGRTTKIGWPGNFCFNVRLALNYSESLSLVVFFCQFADFGFYGQF